MALAANESGHTAHSVQQAHPKKALGFSWLACRLVVAVGRQAAFVDSLLVVAVPCRDAVLPFRPRVSAVPGPWLVVLVAFVAVPLARASVVPRCAVVFRLVSFAVPPPPGAVVLAIVAAESFHARLFWLEKLCGQPLASFGV